MGRMIDKVDPADREKYLVDALEQLEKLAESATKAKSYTAAVNAKHRALLVKAELDQLRETRRKSVPPVSVEAHKAEILLEVRRLRTGATESGSYVAAAQLMKLERELIAADEAERRREEADRLAATSTEDLYAEAHAYVMARQIEQ